MKTPAPADDASSTPTRKRTKTRPAVRRRTLENTYSDPALRERLKNEIRTAAKGGEPGTWSARKSQLLTLAYQKAGGGYVNRHPNSKQKEPKEGIGRYLPKKAWTVPSDAEKKAGSAPKKASTKAGELPVANATAAKKGRKKSE